MSTWNHRVFRTEESDGSFFYTIRECFYDEDGQLMGWTGDAIAPGGQTLEELSNEIEWFAKALTLPVLDGCEGKT